MELTWEQLSRAIGFQPTKPYEYPLLEDLNQIFDRLIVHIEHGHYQSIDPAASLLLEWHRFLPDPVDRDEKEIRLRLGVIAQEIKSRKGK